MRGMWAWMKKGAVRFVEMMAYADDVGLYGWNVTAPRTGIDPAPPGAPAQRPAAGTGPSPTRSPARAAA